MENAQDVERERTIREAIVEVSLLKKSLDLAKEQYDNDALEVISAASKKNVKRFSESEYKLIKKAGEALAKDKIHALYNETHTSSRILKAYLELQ